MEFGDALAKRMLTLAPESMQERYVEIITDAIIPVAVAGGVGLFQDLGVRVTPDRAIETWEIGEMLRIFHIAAPVSDESKILRFADLSRGLASVINYLLEQLESHVDDESARLLAYAGAIDAIFGTIGELRILTSSDRLILRSKTAPGELVRANILDGLLSISYVIHSALNPTVAETSIESEKAANIDRWNSLIKKEINENPESNVTKLINDALLRYREFLTSVYTYCHLMASKNLEYSWFDEKEIPKITELLTNYRNFAIVFGRLRPGEMEMDLSEWVQIPHGKVTPYADLRFDDGRLVDVKPLF